MVRLGHHVVLSEPPTSGPFSLHAGRALTVSTHPLTSSQPVPMMGLCLSTLHWSDQDSKGFKALV